MNLQEIFERNENTAVAVIFILFLITHFGLIYLLGVV